MRPDLEQLIRDFADPARGDDSALYAREELRQAECGPPARRTLVSGWITRAREVDDFIAAHGRIPVNGRQGRPGGVTESRMADWLVHQRTRLTPLCTYQECRLELIPGFFWDPRDDRWDARLTEMIEFVQSNSRLPRYRSSDQVERRLAGWFADQSSRRAEGSLSYRRALELRDAERRIDLALSGVAGSENDPFR